MLNNNTNKKKYLKNTPLIMNNKLNKLKIKNQKRLPLKNIQKLKKNLILLKKFQLFNLNNYNQNNSSLNLKINLNSKNHSNNQFKMTILKNKNINKMNNK